MNSGRSEFIKGIAIALLGAICFSTKAIFVKLAYHHADVSAPTLLTLRMIFSLPFFLLFAVASSRKEYHSKLTGSQWLKIALIGCLGYYVSSLLDFRGLQYISAGLERLVLFIYPTFVLLISAGIFKVSIRPTQWVALAVTYVGLLIALTGEVHMAGKLDASFIEGSLFIFLCAITYATYIVGSGRLIPSVGSTRFNSYAMSFASAGVFVHYIFLGDGSLLVQPLMVYVYSFLMAILSTVVPSYLVVEGIKRIGSENAAIVGSVGPVSTILMAYFFLGEHISVSQIIGTIFIVGGVLIIGKKEKIN